MIYFSFYFFFFFFNDTATTEIYTLSLHDALPISYSALALAELAHRAGFPPGVLNVLTGKAANVGGEMCANPRSEEHTSELQSHSDIVCRLLLEKKKKTRECNR